MKKIILLLVFTMNYLLWTIYSYEFILPSVWDENLVIGCLKSSTLETRSITKSWNCYWWKGWMNIIYPKDSLLIVLQDRWADEAVVNRMPIINFESWFNPDAENYRAEWLVQTLKKYKVGKIISDQLDWLKKRDRRTLSEKFCGKYWKVRNSNDGFSMWVEWVLACYYRHHFHAFKWQYYARRAMSAREYYYNWIYFNNNYINDAK